MSRYEDTQKDASQETLEAVAHSSIALFIIFSLSVASCAEEIAEKDEKRMSHFNNKTNPISTAEITPEAFLPK